MPADLSLPWIKDGDEAAGVGPVDPSSEEAFAFEAGSGSGKTRPLAVVPKKGAGSNSAVTVDTAADLVLAANANRKEATLVNAGAVVVYLGTGSGVTASTGIPLYPGGAYVDDRTTGTWYGITASGTGNIRVLEVA